MVHARGRGRGRDRCAVVAEVGLSESRRGEEEGTCRSAEAPDGGQMSLGATSEDKAIPPSRWSGLVPAARWLRTYQPAWLRADLVAGITLAAYLLPAGLGDASLANLPPEAGLYACLFGGLVFWLFC